MANNQQQPAVYTFDRVVRIVLSTAVLISVLWLLRYLSDVLIPFVAAVIIAYLLNPLVTIIERHTRHRAAAVFFSLGGLGILGFTVLVIFLPLAYSQALRLSQNLLRLRDDLVASIQWERYEETPATPPMKKDQPTTKEDTKDSDTGNTPSTESEESAQAEKSMLGWTELREGLRSYHEQKDLPTPQRLAILRDHISDTFMGRFFDAVVGYLNSEEFQQLLVKSARYLALQGLSAVTFAVNLILGLTGLIIVLLYLIFLLLDYPHYRGIWRTSLPPPYREPILEFFHEFNLVLRRYFRGQSLVALCVGILFAIGFSLIGLPLAIPFGLFVGLLNMVPYLQTVALIPATLLAVIKTIEGDSGFVLSMVLVLMVFAVVQLIQDALLTPRILGQATGLRPVAILLGLFIWGKLLGFLGLLLAIPLTCLGIAYYRRYVLLQTQAASVAEG